MRTNPTLLQDLTPDDSRCFCPQHYRGTDDPRRGRARFRTDTWNAEAACQRLGIHWADDRAALRTDALRDTEMGCSTPNGIWLRPDANFPVKTAAHEIAHQVHGHHHVPRPDDPVAQKYIIAVVEIIAESTAMLVADALGVPDAVASAKQYLSYYFNDLGIPARLPQAAIENITRAADQILAAGWVAEEEVMAA